jgi:hypothetical protein
MKRLINFRKRSDLAETSMVRITASLRLARRIIAQL